MSAVVELFINVDVPDLEAATRFYVDAFGFRLGRRLGDAGTELLGASVPLYLLQQPAASEAAPGSGARRTYARHWTPVHLDVVVADIGAARERALAAGARAEGEVSRHAWGYMARLADPFGHGVCLLQLEPGGYDAISSG
ncbi:MAG TPA: VOC family protein [Polyangiaceae bacterium]|nr:VOC family protein [Polyangiaceae bacterium]